MSWDLMRFVVCKGVDVEGSVMVVTTSSAFELVPHSKHSSPKKGSDKVVSSFEM